MTREEKLKLAQELRDALRSGSVPTHATAYATREIYRLEREAEGLTIPTEPDRVHE